MLGQVQDPGAISEQGRTPFAEIETPCVELAQGGNQPRRGVSFACGESPDFAQQRGVGKEYLIFDLVLHVPL